MRPILFMFVLIAAASPLVAQHADTTLLGTMRTAYRQLDYARTEAIAELVLANYASYSIDHLTETHTTLALIHYAQNRHDASRRHFEAALSLKGDLELDPLLVSPKILAFFEDVKAEAVARYDETEPTVVVRYVIRDDPRRGAALRSMLLPGWGQLYKRETKKGSAIIGVWGGAAVGLLTSHVARQRARRAYLDARDPDLIADRYDRYNRLNKVRNGFALAAAAVWAYGYLDALVKPGPAFPSNLERPAFTWTPALAGPYPALTFVYRF